MTAAASRGAAADAKVVRRTGFLGAHKCAKKSRKVEQRGQSDPDQRNPEPLDVGQHNICEEHQQPEPAQKMRLQQHFPSGHGQIAKD